MLSLLLLLACSGQGAAPDPVPDAPAVEILPEEEAPAVEILPEEEAPAEEAPAERCEDTETKRYVGKLDECPRIRFACADGEEYFSDDCGCGCEEP